MKVAVGRVACQAQYANTLRRATFDREAAAGYHADMKLADLPATPGSYVLLLTTGKPIILNMPRLGKVTLAAGQYAYVGSAHGPGGLGARVGRHLRAEKPLHWHIDHLTAALPVVHIVAAEGTAQLECVWAKRLIALDGASVPAPGFGSSDCRNGCSAHLVRLPDDLRRTELEEILSVEDGAGPAVSPRALEDMVQALLDAISTGDDAAAEQVAQACTGQTALLPALRPLLADTDPRWCRVWVTPMIGLLETVIIPA